MATAPVEFQPRKSSFGRFPGCASGGRRNLTFLGSDSGGDRAAVFYTLIQTCKLNGINPEAYLADVIGRIGEHPAKLIDELLSWTWQASQAPADQVAA